MGIGVFSPHPTQLMNWGRDRSTGSLCRVLKTLAALKPTRAVANTEFRARRGQFGWMPETMWRRNSALLQSRLELERSR